MMKRHVLTVAAVALLGPWTPGCTDPAVEGRSPVVINELTSEGSDEIELYNASDAEVDIGGWILTDDAFVMASYDPTFDQEKYVFPAGTVLPAGAFLVIPKGDLEGHHKFGVKSSGETLTLISPEGELMDQVTYFADQAELSFCRYPDGSDDWQICSATFGSPNKQLETCTPDCSGLECGDDGCGGSCGTCTVGVCDQGSCVCTPDCTGLECGNDGCGGSCGSCADNEICDAGTCAPGATLCDQCIQASCSAEWAACEANPDCPPLQQCVMGCQGDNTCMQGCAATYPDGTDDATTLGNCIDSNCSAECHP